MRAFAFFTEKHLQLTNFTTAVNCKNQKLKYEVKSLKYKSLKYESRSE